MRNSHFKVEYLKTFFEYDQHETTFFCSCDQSSKHAIISIESSSTSHLLFETQKNQLVRSIFLTSLFHSFWKKQFWNSSSNWRSISLLNFRIFSRIFLTMKVKIAVISKSLRRRRIINLKAKSTYKQWTCQHLSAFERDFCSQDSISNSDRILSTNIKTNIVDTML